MELTFQLPAHTEIADSGPLPHCGRNLALGNGTKPRTVSLTCGPSVVAMVNQVTSMDNGNRGECFDLGFVGLPLGL